MSEDKKTLKVDPEKCTSCGMCVSQCDTIFEMDTEENVSKVISQDYEDCGCNIQDIIDDCPGAAISLE